MITQSSLKPCYLWDFPFEELDSNQLRIISTTRKLTSPETSEASSPSHSEEESCDSLSSDEEDEAASWTCRICELAFDHPTTQRLHFQSQQHQLKISSPQNENTSTFDIVVKPFNELSLNNTEDKKSPLPERSSPSISPFLIFQFTQLPQIQFKMFPHVLWSPKTNPTPSFKEIFNGLIQFREKKMHVIYIIFVGGCFVMAEFENHRCIEHMSIRRYVTRRKQGGRQSSHDQKNHARSAGANLRRHNEQALFQEAVQSLTSWAEVHFPRSNRVFYYAPSHNKKILHYVPTSSFLCSIPCSVRKPNLNEVHRLHEILYTLQKTSPSPLVKESMEVDTQSSMPQVVSVKEVSKQMLPENYRSTLPETSSICKKKKKKNRPPQLAGFSKESLEVQNVHDLLPMEPQQLAPVSMSPLLQQWLKDSPESKILEREKRALAAERRRGPSPFVSPAPSKPVEACAQCQQSVVRMPIKRYQHVFCSIPCSLQWKKENPTD